MRKKTPSQEAEITPERKIDNADLQTSQGSQTDMPDELPIDSSWDDVYEYSMESGGNSAESG